MIYGIPSYHRPQCRTVQTLLNAGVEPERIIVSLQDKQDIEPFQRNYPHIRYVYRPTDCASGNRNTLLDTINERPVCLMDDDINGMSEYTGKQFVRGDLEELIEKVSKEAKYQGCVLAGFSSTTNGLFASAKPYYSIDIVLQGGALIFLDDSLRFDENYKIVEDFEISCRAIYAGLHILKANHIAFNLYKKSRELQGGCFDRYQNGELEKYLKRLSRQYPLFRISKNKTNGNIVWR